MTATVSSMETDPFALLGRRGRPDVQADGPFQGLTAPELRAALKTRGALAIGVTNDILSLFRLFGLSDATAGTLQRVTLFGDIPALTPDAITRIPDSELVSRLLGFDSELDDIATELDALQKRLEAGPSAEIMTGRTGLNALLAHIVCMRKLADCHDLEATYSPEFVARAHRRYDKRFA